MVYLYRILAALRSFESRNDSFLRIMTDFRKRLYTHRYQKITEIWSFIRLGRIPIWLMWKLAHRCGPFSNELKSYRVDLHTRHHWGRDTDSKILSDTHLCVVCLWSEWQHRALASGWLGSWGQLLSNNPWVSMAFSVGKFRLSLQTPRGLDDANIHVV